MYMLVNKVIRLLAEMTFIDSFHSDKNFGQNCIQRKRLCCLNCKYVTFLVILK